MKRLRNFVIHRNLSATLRHAFRLKVHVLDEVRDMMKTWSNREAEKPDS